MRFAPVAAALSLFLATTASVTSASDRAPDPRAAQLIALGQTALENGDTQGAIDAFESAFAVDPSYTPIFLQLAEAARQDGLQGKAIAYYREALQRDPDNFAAISGEGEALVERGAVEKAQRNLSRLESLCGSSCPETMALQQRIAAGPPARLAVETMGDSGDESAVTN
ncbi:tetratricopeptide repeat protein [Erythrobacter longus]|nr:tetratricopeptide repeat protein [Erythrobacter longus]